MPARILSTHLNRHPSPSATSIAALMVAAMVVLTQLYWIDWLECSRWAPASGQAIWSHGELWRLITAVFVHADLAHLLGNSYMLFILGFFVAGYFGVWQYPATALGLSALVNGIVVLTYPPEAQLIGASGLVYLLAGFWLTLYLHLDRRLQIWARCMRAVGVGLVVLFPTAFEPSVSYRTHAVALGVGVIWGLGYFWIHRRWFRRRERIALEPVENLSDSEGPRIRRDI